MPKTFKREEVAFSTLDEDMMGFSQEEVRSAWEASPLFDSKTKKVVNLLSEVVQDVKPHLECPNPLGAMDTIAPSLREAVAIVAAKTHDEFKNFVDYEDLELLCPEPLRIALNEVIPILKHDYLPVATREKQGQIAKAFVAPFLGFLDAELSTRPPGAKVLILGAGEGKDIRRIQSRVHTHVQYVCVEPDKIAAGRLKHHYPDATLFVSTVGGVIDKLVEYGPFDIIVANVCSHYIFGVPSGRLLAEEMSKILAPTGIMYGSYIDTQSIKASGLQQSMKTGHSVTYVAESHSELCYGELPTMGLATVSVAGVLWQDPIVDVNLFYDLFETTPLSVSVYDGHTMVFGPETGSPIYKCPEEMSTSLDRPELRLLRCVLISHPKDPINRPYSVPTSLVDARSTGLAEEAMIYTFNKGKPLQPYESQYVHPQLCWIGEKKDGVMAKLVNKAKGMEIIIGHGRSLKVKAFSSEVFDEFVLQVELVPTTGTGHVTDNGTKYWVVVTDVLRCPWGAKSNFISRWKWLVHIYDTRKPMDRTVSPPVTKDWPFVLQQWARLDSPEAFDILANAKEGVVTQSLTAPMGAIRQGAGSARYVKRVYTIDVRIGGQVEEQTLDGRFIRYRPDKEYGNPQNVVESIMTAMSYGDFVAYVLYAVIGAAGASAERVSKNMISRKPLGEWEKADLLWLYRNRYTEFVERVFPGASKYLDVLFPPGALKDTLAQPSPIHHKTFEEEEYEFYDIDHEFEPEVHVCDKIPSAAIANPISLELDYSAFDDTQEWDEALHVVARKKREVGGKYQQRSVRERRTYF